MLNTRANVSCSRSLLLTLVLSVYTEPLWLTHLILSNYVAKRHWIMNIILFVLYPNTEGQNTVSFLEKVSQRLSDRWSLVSAKNGQATNDRALSAPTRHRVSWFVPPAHSWHGKQTIVGGSWLLIRLSSVYLPAYLEP